jgi:glutamine synthetase
VPNHNLFLPYNKILQENIAQFQQKSSQYCQNFCIGAELEFYVFSNISPLVSANQEQLHIFLKNISNCKTEQGCGQLEVVFQYTDNFFTLLAEILQTKKHIYDLAIKHNLWVSFAGKPLIADCGSALQFSISCIAKNQQECSFISNFYVMMAVSLLENTKKNLPILTLYQQDYLRYCQKANLYLFSQQKNTSPINLSFGYNNRSCAIRITKGEATKRLEYRVASASASPSLVLCFIFSALNFGLEKYMLTINTKLNSEAFGPVFGNSFDKQYNLIPLL